MVLSVSTPLSRDLENAVVFVIGGHSGIGLAAVQEFLSYGATVIIGYGHNAERARQVVNEFSQQHRSVDAKYCDVTVIEAIEHAVADIEKSFGHLDIVVSAAGTTKFIPMDNLDLVTEDVWNTILRTNVIGAWNVARVVRASLERSRIGNLVYVGSIAGIRPSGSSIPYAVSKAALHHMVRTLAKAYAPNARVNAVAPGTIDTPWMEGHTDMLEVAHRTALLQRAGMPSEVAHAIVYLATTRYATGSIVVVDGGLSLT